MPGYLFISTGLLISEIILVVITISCYKFFNKVLKILAIFFIVSLLVEASSQYMAINKIHNIWLFNLFILIRYCLLAYMFSYWFLDKSIKKWVQASLLIFFIAWLIRNFIYGGFTAFDNFSYSLSTGILIVLSLYTLIQFQRNSHLDFKEPQFWVSAIILICCGGTLIINSMTPTYLTWSIHNTIYILANFSFAGLITWHLRPALRGL